MPPLRRDKPGAVPWVVVSALVLIQLRVCTTEMLLACLSWCSGHRGVSDALTRVFHAASILADLCSKTTRHFALQTFTSCQLSHEMFVNIWQLDSIFVFVKLTSRLFFCSYSFTSPLYRHQRTPPCSVSFYLASLLPYVAHGLLPGSAVKSRQALFSLPIVPEACPVMDRLPPHLPKRYLSS